MAGQLVLCFAPILNFDHREFTARSIFNSTSLFGIPICRIYYVLVYSISHTSLRLGRNWVSTEPLVDSSFADDSFGIFELALCVDGDFPDKALAS